MNEILTNEEIDTLLDLFRSEGDLEVPAGAASAYPSAGDYPTVDLLKPNRVSRDLIRHVHRLLEQASKAMSVSISDRLRLDVSCDCVAVEQVRFQSWLGALTGPVAIYVLKMPSFDQPVLLGASTSLLYGAVDRILGGLGRVEVVPSDFTAAEYTVADAFIGPCLDRIRDALAEVVDLAWSVESRFCNPAMAQILPSQDVVLAVHFQVSGDALIGDLWLALPFASLEKHLERLDGAHGARPAARPGALRDVIERGVAGSSLDLSVRLGEARLPLAQLLQLRVGDVVPLQTRFGEPLVAPVRDRPKFTGQVGTLGRRLAFRVGEVLRD